MVYLTGKRIDGRGPRKPKKVEGGLVSQDIYLPDAMYRPRPLITEGEPDTIIGRQCGLEISGILGATSIPTGFAKKLRPGAVVGVLVDQDGNHKSGGRAAEDRLYGVIWREDGVPHFTDNGLENVARFLRPEYPGKCKDLNDAFLAFFKNTGSYKQAEEALRQCVKRAWNDAEPYVGTLLTEIEREPKEGKRATKVKARVIPVLARMDEVERTPYEKRAGKLLGNVQAVRSAVNKVVADLKAEKQRAQIHVVQGGKQPETPSADGDGPQVLEDGTVVPEGWAVNNGRLFTSETKWSQTRKEHYLHETEIAERVPVYTRFFEEADSENEAVEVSFPGRRTGTVKIIRTCRQDVMSRAGCLKLAATGFPSYEENAKKIATWMAKLEHANRDRLPTVTSSRSMGWHGDVFIFGDLTIGGDNPVFVPADLGDDQTAKALVSGGTFEAWKDQILLPVAESYPTMLFSIIAAHTPVILKAVGVVGGFVVEFASADSSIGKTHALLVAESCWGRPGSPGFHQSSNASFTAPERMFATLGHGLPSFRDEGKLQDPRRYVEMIYAAANGVGRDRGSVVGRQRTSEWTTTLFLSSEKSVTAMSPDGGITGRCITIDYSPMGAVNDTTKVDIENFRETALKNYGHSGPAFVKYLQETGDWQRLARDCYQESLASLGDAMGVSGIMKRKTEHLAAVLTCAILLKDLWGVDAEQQLRDLFLRWSTEMPDRDLPKEALEATKDWILRKGRHLIDGVMHKENSPDDIKESDYVGVNFGEDLYGLFKEPLIKFLEEHGYGADMLGHWVRRGWLRVTAKARTYPMQFFGRRRRVCLFEPHVWAYEKDPEELF